MQRITLRCIRVTLLLLVAVTLLGGGIAEAVNKLDKVLKGQYRSNFFTSCAQNDSDGFGADFEYLNPNSPHRGRFRTIATRGTRTYNGDGTGFAAVVALIVFDDDAPGDIAVTQSTLNCNLNYSVDPDFSFTEMVSCNGTIGTGPDAGDQFTVTGIVLNGQVSPNREILSFSDTGTNIETFINTTQGITFVRICGRSGTAIKVK